MSRLLDSPSSLSNMLALLGNGKTAALSESAVLLCYALNEWQEMKWKNNYKSYTGDKSARAYFNILLHQEVYGNNHACLLIKRSCSEIF